MRIYDSTGKRLKTIGGRGAGPGEFRNIFRLGWTRDTLRIYDASLRRILYFGRDLTLLRGTVLSDALRQPVQGDNPRSAPVHVLRGGGGLERQREASTRRGITRR